MWMWLFMLVMDLLLPLVMICFGGRFETDPPREISAAFGYRTARSMKNWDTWCFAHRVCGRLWRRCGFSLLIVSAMLLICVFGEDIADVCVMGLVVSGVQLLVVASTIFLTELSLKNRFDEDGRRR